MVIYESRANVNVNVVAFDHEEERSELLDAGRINDKARAGQQAYGWLHVRTNLAQFRKRFAKPQTFVIRPVQFAL